MESIESFDQDSNTSTLNNKNKSTTYSYSGKVLLYFLAIFLKQK